MTDYTPPGAPSKIVTLTASNAAISGGDLLEVAATGTVRKCTTSQSMSYVGTAAYDTLANGRVTVYARGWVHESVAEGTVNAGDQLVTSSVANRQVVTLPPLGGAPGQADVNAARAIIGIALTTATGPAKCRWMEF
jgi:hypothetical protein